MGQPPSFKRLGHQADAGFLVDATAAERLLDELLGLLMGQRAWQLRARRLRLVGLRIGRAAAALNHARRVVRQNSPAVLLLLLAALARGRLHEGGTDL